MEECLLNLKDLTIRYVTYEGIVRAVNGISLMLRRGETLGLVGETGAGKTTTALGIMGLLPVPPAEVCGGEILLDGVDLRKESELRMRKIRGKKVSMVFQDPMTALNPVLTIGDQMMEVIREHERISAVQAGVKAKEMLELVGIPDDRFGDYPHQFSGGMKQRVVIAMALACNPELLIADEPTTALDVTIQAQVLSLMSRLKQELNTAMLLITHDLGVVAEICDKVAIMYAGEIVEYGALDEIYDNTKHPYTVGLFGSIPDLDVDSQRLTPILGLMPDPSNLPQGCKFWPRCPCKTQQCQSQQPVDTEVAPGHMVKCHLYQK